MKSFKAIGSIGDGLMPILHKSAPQVALFSARGPNIKDFSFQDADLLKPDILAPGSLIWAAWSPNGTDEPNYVGNDKQVSFVFLLAFRTMEFWWYSFCQFNVQNRNGNIICFSFTRFSEPPSNIAVRITPELKSIVHYLLVVRIQIMCCHLYIYRCAIALFITGKK